MHVEVETPEEYAGNIMGDLSSRRGMVQGMAEQYGSQIIRADVPLAEMFGYATTLRSMSQGARRIRWSSIILRKLRGMWRMRLLRSVLSNKKPSSSGRGLFFLRCVNPAPSPSSHSSQTSRPPDDAAYSAYPRQTASVRRQMRVHLPRRKPLRQTGCHISRPQK